MWRQQPGDGSEPYWAAAGVWGESPIFLTLAHAKTLFDNSVDLLVEFSSIISKDLWVSGR